MFEALGPLQYRRTLLAELLLGWTDSGYRILTYREFWDLYSKAEDDDSDLLAEIDPVIDLLAVEKTRKKVLRLVERVVRKISDEIGVSSTLPSKASA